MELVMMDQNTANRVIHQKNKDLYKVDVFQLQHEIKEKENKEKKLKQTIKIMIVSFVFGGSNFQKLWNIHLTKT